MPLSRAVRITRQAISPRLATRILENMEEGVMAVVDMSLGREWRQWRRKVWRRDRAILDGLGLGIVEGGRFGVAAEEKFDIYCCRK